MAHMSSEVGVMGGGALDYYPGMEIHGYMPHRGDFAFVRTCTLSFHVAMVMVLI